MGPELVQQTNDLVKKIQQRLLTAQSRQKSYADKRRRPLSLDVDDMMFLKVSPRKGIQRYGKKGKLAPRFIGPFKIVSKIGNVAYQLVGITSVVIQCSSSIPCIDAEENTNQIYHM